MRSRRTTAQVPQRREATLMNRTTPDGRASHSCGAGRTVLRITLDAVVALVVLLVVAVGVGIFGVVEESEKVTRRWPSLR